MQIRPLSRDDANSEWNGTEIAFPYRIRWPAWPGLSVLYSINK